MDHLIAYNGFAFKCFLFYMKKASLIGINFNWWRNYASSITFSGFLTRNYSTLYCMNHPVVYEPYCIVWTICFDRPSPISVYKLDFLWYLMNKKWCLHPLLKNCLEKQLYHYSLDSFGGWLLLLTIILYMFWILCRLALSWRLKFLAGITWPRITTWKH